MMKKTTFLCFSLLLAYSLSAQYIDNIRVMTYNLLQYGITTGPNCTPSTVTSKNGWLNIILGYYKPDLLVVNELRWNNNNAYALNIKTNVLNNYNAAMNITTAGNSAGSDIGNMLFYNSNKFSYLSHAAITGNVRDIDVYELYHKAATTAGDTAKLWVIACHLKAGNTSTDAVQRGAMAADIMAWLAAHPTVQNYLVMGDFNLYSSSEAAYQTFTDANNAFRFYDPSGVTTGWSGSSFKNIHTQCPSTSTANCFSGGGLDDRFDFILMSKAIKDNTAKITYKPSSYRTFGNDGVSYNAGLNCGATTSVPATVCNALTQNSDHLPVIMELEIATTVANESPFLQGIEMNVLGNPIKDNQLSLQFVFEQKADDGYKFAIIDMMGREWMTETIQNRENTFIKNIDVSSLSNGMYLMVLQAKNGKTLSRAFIK